MHHCHLLYKIAFLFCFWALPSLADQFLMGTEDVPLIDGMTYSVDETFSFDNEEGRLYFSKTFISLKPQKIWDFYEKTLPQLGWQKSAAGVFEREGDVLRIGVVDEDYHSEQKTTVIFELITKSK